MLSYSPYDVVVSETMADEARGSACGRLPPPPRRCARPRPPRMRSAGLRILFMHLNTNFARYCFIKQECFNRITGDRLSIWSSTLLCEPSLCRVNFTSKEFYAAPPKVTTLWTHRYIMFSYSCRRQISCSLCLQFKSAAVFI